METMRANQRAVARSLNTNVGSNEGRLDTREVKRSLAIVPFRHSKLTEVLMDYFVGEGGRVVSTQLLLPLPFNVSLLQPLFLADSWS